MLRPVAPLAVLLVAGTIAACGSDDKQSARARTATTAKHSAPAKPHRAAHKAKAKHKSKPAATAPVRTPRTSAGCKLVPAPPAKGPLDRPKPRLRLESSTKYTAVLRTTCGTIRIRLDVHDSPKTTASFVALARDGFYDGLTFHRISRPAGRDFVIQGGDPAGNGSGGPGYSVVEPPPRNVHYTRGVVAMAKTEIEDPGTSGSQFFIVTAKNSRLPPNYARLGHVVGSQKAVKRIAASPADPTTEMPSDPIVIEKVTIQTN